jgi:hypothetical protein
MRFLLVITLVLAAVAGCGEVRVPVKGKVTLDGQPVDSGSISFQPADGAGPGTGGVIKDGFYSLAGESAATPGKKNVHVTAMLKTGRKVKAGPPHPPDMMVDEIISFPPRGTRNPPIQSAEIVSGRENEINFDLNSK